MRAFELSNLLHNGLEDLLRLCARPMLVQFKYETPRFSMKKTAYYFEKRLGI